MSDFNNKANNLFLIAEDPSIHEKQTIKDVAYEGAKEIKDLQQQLEQKDSELMMQLVYRDRLEEGMERRANKIYKLKARNEKLERLGVLATKHCPSSHADFEEIKAIYVELDGGDE